MFENTAEEERIFYFDLVLHSFFKAAEEDYFFARQALFLALPQQFCWHASQSIEKYYKAAILFNSGSVKNNSHDLTLLHKKFSERFGTDSPELLFPPNDLPMSVEGKRYWHLYTIEDFIRYLVENGKPSVRYKTRGSRIWGASLHHFDEVVFQIRRFCIPLEGWGNRQESQNLALLKNEKSLQPQGDLFAPRSPKILSEELGNRIIRSLNYSFFPEHVKGEGRFHNRFVEQGTAIARSLHSGSPSRRALNRFLENTKSDKDLVQKVRNICSEYENGERACTNVDLSYLHNSLASVIYGRG